MPWIAPNPDFAATFVQVPYFQLPRTNRGTFIQTYVRGFCLGHTLRIGPTFFPGPGSAAGYWGSGHSYVSTLPVRLSSLRVRVGRTGSVSSANLVAAVWHSNYDASLTSIVSGFDYGLPDFTSLPPDATASVPLASLPLVDPVNNTDTISTGCGVPLVPQTEMLLNRPVVFGRNPNFSPVGVRYPGDTQYTYWECFMALYVDSGFSAVSNLVIGAFNDGSGIAGYVSDNLNFSRSTTVVGTGSPYWFEGPNCGVAPAGAIEAYPDLLLDPIGGKRGFAQVVG